MAAAPIDRDHAAHRGHTAHRGVGTEMPAARSQILIELSVDQPRLDAHCFAVVVKDAAHEAGEIEDQAAAQRFTGQACAGSASMDRQPVFGGVLYASDHILERLRPYN